MDVQTLPDRHGCFRPTAPRVTRSVVDEVTSYSTSVAGIQLEAVRAGAGNDLSEVAAVHDDRFTFTSSYVGFPMLSRTTLGDDMICIARMRRTVPGSRWCGMSLESGSTIAYGPSADHTARNLAGTQFMFLVTGHEQCEELADLLGTRFDPPPRGEVHLLAPTAKTNLVGLTLATYANHAATGEIPLPSMAEAAMTAVTVALSEEVRPQRIGSARRIDTRRVVRDCIDYADEVHRIPTISELCLKACVSERTLREAFTREYDLSPLRYFRSWALEQAHRRLVDPDDDMQNVTDIATGLGFNHLGRFAGCYRQAYGETPSTTLRRLQH